MNHHLRILHLEDDLDYPELLLEMLRQDGLNVSSVQVSTEPEYESCSQAAQLRPHPGRFPTPHLQRGGGA